MPAKLISAAVAALLLAACSTTARPPPLAGDWLTASGNVVVRIVPCNGALCGDVVRVLANNSMQANRPQTAPPPTVGLRILSDLRPDGGAWRGHLFNRENGKTYDARVRPTNGTLEVRGYVVLPLFGRTQVWRPG